MENLKYKFIVFEGIDGSGKETQSKLLKRSLIKKGIKVNLISFPQYKKESSFFIREYLNGKFGELNKVSAYQAGIFYALDRFEAKFKIKAALLRNEVVIADRYFPSNIAFQSAKISNKRKQVEFLKWIENLEFKIFEIPKPDIVLILDVPPKIACKLSKKKDIHEKDFLYLEKVYKIYKILSKKNPKKYKLIKCIEGEKLLSKIEIHKRIIKVLNIL